MMADLDVEQLRSETLGCKAGAHFNHSGASLPSRSTLETIWDYLREEAADDDDHEGRKKDRELQHALARLGPLRFDVVLERLQDRKGFRVGMRGRIVHGDQAAAARGSLVGRRLGRMLGGNFTHAH